MDNVVLFKVIEEDGELVLMFDRDEFKKFNLQPGDYMIMGRIGENGIMLSKVDFPNT